MLEQKQKSLDRLNAAIARLPKYILCEPIKLEKAV